MRLLLVSGSYPPMKCGVGDYTYQLARALAAEGEIEVGVLTSEAASPGAISAPGVEVLAEMPGWASSDARTAIRILRRWKPDAVHIQWPTQGYGLGRLPTLLPVIAKLMGMRVVQTWHESTSLRGVVSFMLRAIVPGKIIVVRPGFRKGLHPVLRTMLFSRELAFVANASSIVESRLDAGQRLTLKQTYLAGQQRLIVFFGFVYPFKGVDLLFEIADAAIDRIIVAGELEHDTDYGRQLHSTAATAPWAGKVTFTGFLAPQAASDLLAVSDAVVLPFRRGGGEWNTSIHGAVANGAYVITTSEQRRGFDAQLGIHYSPVDDVLDMKNALALVEQRRPRPGSVTVKSSPNAWQTIAQAHAAMYQVLLGARASKTD